MAAMEALSVAAIVLTMPPNWRRIAPGIGRVCGLAGIAIAFRPALDHPESAVRREAGSSPVVTTALSAGSAASSSSRVCSCRTSPVLRGIEALGLGEEGTVLFPLELHKRPVIGSTLFQQLPIGGHGSGTL